MKSVVFRAKVRAGRMALNDPEKFGTFVAKLEGKDIRVTIEEVWFQRSKGSNNFYWLYLTQIVEETDGVATKDRIESMHEYFKRQLLPPVTEKVKLPGGKVVEFRRPRSTTELDPIEMTEYINTKYPNLKANKPFSEETYLVTDYLKNALTEAKKVKVNFDAAYKNYTQ